MPLSKLAFRPATALKLGKRQRVVLAVVVLVAILAGLSATNLLGPSGEVGWLVLVYVATVIVLETDLKREEWLILPLLPIIWGASFLGWITLAQPTSLMLTACFLVIALGLYAIFLAVNIVNVATVRTVPLLRTAITTLQLVGLWCDFLLLYLLRSQQPPVWQWVGSSIILTIAVVLPLLWINYPNPGKLRRALLWSLFVGLVTGQLALFSAFWPSTFIDSLFLASNAFILTGLLYYQEQRNLTAKIERQYLWLSILVCLTLYLLTRWGG